SFPGEALFYGHRNAMQRPQGTAFADFAICRLSVIRGALQIRPDDGIECAVISGVTSDEIIEHLHAADLTRADFCSQDRSGEKSEFGHKPPVSRRRAARESYCG